MLIITRRVGEVLYIGDSIVRVLGVRGRNVRLGVSAPRKVVVDREEVRIRKEREKELATLGETSTATVGGTVGRKGR